MSATTPWVFDLCGGHLALDFANTVSNRQLETRLDRLSDHDALVDFAQQTGLLVAGEARRQRQWAREHPRQAEALLGRARTLREATYKVFAATAAGNSPATEDLEVLNAWHRRLELGPSLQWRWAGDPHAPDAFLGPVVRAAVELLTSGLRSSVRLGEADDCVWVFLDTSKNHSRRWCDVKQCGNRAKARRFAERARSSA